MASLFFREKLTDVGVFTARPAAFVIWAIFVVLWIVFDRDSLDWHGAATAITWLMTLFIQRAGHRDTQAIQAKLDELLRTHESASTELADIDQKEPEEIERSRAESASR